MAYKELKKLYYSGQEVYRETYMQRFSSDNTVRLDFDVAGYQAFFVQCEDVINLTYHILKLDKEILRLRALLPEVALEQYSKRCFGSRRRQYHNRRIRNDCFRGYDAFGGDTGHGRSV